MGTHQRHDDNNRATTAKPQRQPQPSKHREPAAPKPDGSLVKLCVCVVGIYATFLTWGVLQERIFTAPYGVDKRIFRGSHALNITQSILAAALGYFYLTWRRSHGDRAAQFPLLPNRRVFVSYLMVAACQALSSPFAYASMQYVDFVTVLLAKSCKLLPVMAVHLLLYRKKFPANKYVAVALVTAGVALFSIAHPQANAKSQVKQETWGILLLGVNLFLDGLYNTGQDQMFAQFPYITGPHMMVVFNVITAAITSAVFLFSAQKEECVWFAVNHPRVYWDIIIFGLCGAVGQVFIFITLAEFGSVVLVTTTVTRKMISMLLSVAMFNHALQPLQWVGVVLVFAGVVGETALKRRN